MKTVSNSSHASGARTGGFTRAELVSVAAVIALLLALQLSALGAGKGRTKIAQCEANIRQLGLAILMYGNDNGEKLPAETPNGDWLWDLDWQIGETLNRYGATQDNMYCPGTAPRFQPADNEQLYEYYGPNVVHVIGYALALPNAPSLVATNANPTTYPQAIRFGTTNFPPPLSSQRVLVADATLADFSTTSFVHIQGGYKLPHMSPHLNGYVPAGGNVGMLDGHVEWRPFSQMQLRTGRGKTGAEPFFYW